MFPWVYEFQWSAAHIIFLFAFFSVAVVILSAVTIAAMRAYTHFKHRREEKIMWEADFKDLPKLARVCRHELTGEVKHRTCDNMFECGSCDVHPTFLARHNPDLSETNVEPTVFGFNMPPHRRYHRGHTWVENEGNGFYKVGLDDFASRMIGNPDVVELPKPGEQLQTNGTGWLMKKQDATLRILSPIDGEVIERGSPDKGWFLRLKGEETEQATSHLLRREEIRPWILRELERLQRSLATGGLGMTLADGGELMPDIWKQAPDVDWDGVWGEMFLQG
ncbi:MAG: glycine cleavage system protein H [Bacteroidetes bacterium]|nr:glycine cleavage system protein H [Bacteroidota bacterium]MCW5894038.1 glycine cleavage system protein H [Bacteroidota bacterium]